MISGILIGSLICREFVLKIINGWVVSIDRRNKIKKRRRRMMKRSLIVRRRESSMPRLPVVMQIMCVLTIRRLHDNDKLDNWIRKKLVSFHGGTTAVAFCVQYAVVHMTMRFSLAQMKVSNKRENVASNFVLYLIRMVHHPLERQHIHVTVCLPQPREVPQQRTVKQRIVMMKARVVDIGALAVVDADFAVVGTTMVVPTMPPRSFHR